MRFRWALVHCTTTGLQLKQDHIIDLSVLILTEQGIEQSFHTVLKPTCPIPTMVEHLTGITNNMLNNAPSFEDVAPQLSILLDDCVFVAHNARFYYTFIKAALTNSGIKLTLPVLCTLELFKRFYPNATSYELKDLAINHQLPIPDNQHRAETKTFLLYQLIKIMQQQHGIAQLLNTATLCYQRSAIPATLQTDLTTVPNTPGVYLFYGEHSDLPLYIGKSVTLKQRILSHFQAAHLNAKEFKLAQQVTRIEIIPTAGELGALLLESTLIKKHMPLYNRQLRRKKKMVVLSMSQHQGYYHLNACSEPSMNLSSNTVGAYSSMAVAKKALLKLVKNYSLCPKLCYLESCAFSCFSYQLKRCNGACVQAENSDDYNKRVLQAWDSLKTATWPFNGAIAIKEECSINNKIEFMKFNQWRYLGTVTCQDQLARLQDSDDYFDLDTYRILFGYINHHAVGEQLILCD